jgi:hypothetical protein
MPYNIRDGQASDENDMRFRRVLGIPHLVLELDGDAIGRCYIDETATEFIISDFEIREDLRDADHGTYFESQLEARARSHGRIEMNAHDVGPDSEGFWRRMGYSEKSIVNEISTWSRPLPSSVI